MPRPLSRTQDSQLAAATALLKGRSPRRPSLRLPSTAPVRVLHVRNSDRLGGPERLILDQCELASPSLDMVVASFGSSVAHHPFLESARERGVRCLQLERGHSYDPRLFRRVRSLLKASPPSLLVGHDYKADLALLVASQGLNIPIVSVVHGYTAENLKVRVFEALDRHLLRFMNGVVVVSRTLRDELTRGGVRRDRIYLVPNAVDVESVSKAAAEERERVREEWHAAEQQIVVSLGRLSPEKGQDVLLDAFAGWTPPGDQRAKLVLVGDGASRDALERRARALGIAARVRFTGWRDDPHACIGAANVVVLPSRTEGLPLAVLEAMAASRPVVATRVGGVPQALDEGRAGWLVPREDPAALREALTEVLGEPLERARRIAAARERAVAYYGAERQALALEAVYRQVLDQA